jgi:hypothetical protein
MRHLVHKTLESDCVGVLKRRIQTIYQRTAINSRKPKTKLRGRSPQTKYPTEQTSDRRLSANLCG